jgi:soluble lytic murein transglycosylase-like protein
MSVASIPAGPASGSDRDGYRQPACPIESLSSLQKFSASLHAVERGQRQPERTAEARLSFARVAGAVLGPDTNGRPEHLPATLRADPRRRVPVAPGPAQAPASVAPASTPVVSPWVLDAYVRRYAAAYQVDYLLIAAMIRHESNWQPAVVSSKGAIGLMQLMPETAAMLGVNPNDPLDNLRGGIAYLAGLLKTYKDVRLALIAYNAGPDHANRVERGETGVYPETRRYLDTINAIYSLPPLRQP